MSDQEQDAPVEEPDWLEEKVAEARKPAPKPRRPDYQSAMLPCDACQ